MVKVLPPLALAIVSSINGGILSNPVAGVTTNVRTTDPNPVAGVMASVTAPDLASATIQGSGVARGTRVEDAAEESSDEERSLPSMKSTFFETMGGWLVRGSKKDGPSNTDFPSLVSKVTRFEQSGNKRLPKKRPHPLPQPGAQRLPKSGAQRLPRNGPHPLPQPGAQHLPKSEAQRLPKNGPHPLPQPEAQHLPKSEAQRLPKKGPHPLPQPGAQHLPKSEAQRLPKKGPHPLPQPGAQHLTQP
ncbi:unnamed protein product [Hyaloperonospora brassicae]|uniref:RxLR effector candidate protein n=1 Tax=Hyaloperonospora brassicae TaxID=162125 RepID=A0AAV0TCL0_HYABA|nr:unnamed protein product [Hyaloperonospora brassicae]